MFKLYQKMIDWLDLTTRGWLVVFGGQIGQISFGLISSILITRSLGKVDFGIYGVLAATAGIANVLADAGLTTTIARFFGSSYSQDGQKAKQQGQVFFWLRVGLTLIVVLGGLLFVRPIASTLLSLDSMFDLRLLWLTFIGVFFTAISGAVTAMLRGCRHFKQLTVVSLINSGATAILALILNFYHQLNLLTALLILGIGTSILSFIIAQRLLPKSLNLRIPNKNVSKTVGKKMISYSKWIAVANVVAVLTAKTDVIILNQMGFASQLGIYFLAINLANKANLVNHSMYTVLLPAASGLRSYLEVRHYLLRAWLRSFFITVGLLPLFWIATPFIQWAYGTEFSEAAPLFRWLLIVIIIELFATPITFLLFPMGQPKMLAGIETLRLGVFLLVSLMVIPYWGIMGIILAKILEKLISIVAVWVMVKRHWLSFGKVKSSSSFHV